MSLDRTSQMIGTVQVSPGSTPKAKERPPLPAVPVVIVEPTRFWVALDLRALWAYRGLLYFLTWRDVKVGYNQPLLEAGWEIRKPRLTMLILTLFFRKFAS